MKPCKSRAPSQFKALNEKDTIRFLLRKLQDKEAELCYVKSIAANGGRIHVVDGRSEAPWRRQSVACQTDEEEEVLPIPVATVGSGMSGIDMKTPLLGPGREQASRTRSFYSALAESKAGGTEPPQDHPYGLQLRSFGSFRQSKGKERYLLSASSPANRETEPSSRGNSFLRGNLERERSVETDRVRSRIDAIIEKQEEIVQDHVSEVEGIQRELLGLLESHDISDVDPSVHDLEKIEFIQHEVDYKTSVAMFLEEGLQELLEVSHSLDELAIGEDGFSDNQESV